MSSERSHAFTRGLYGWITHLLIGFYGPTE